MAIPTRLRDYDGFRIEAPRGVIGWVEETWLGPSGEPTALAVRAFDGPGAGLLELDVLRLQTVERDGATPSLVSAAWRTTGAVLDLPPALGPVRRALLAVRAGYVTSAPPAGPAERPLWQIVGLLYLGSVALAAVVMALAFMAADVFAGG
jgi:hypothetical protein